MVTEPRRPWWIKMLIKMRIVVNSEDEDFGEKMKFGIKFMGIKFIWLILALLLIGCISNADKNARKYERDIRIDEEMAWF